MNRTSPKALALFFAVNVASIATPATSQSAMSAAQCDAMMMVGTQHFAPTAVAGCTTYFQTLALNAIAPGAFSSSGTMVIVSTSGIGG